MRKEQQKSKQTIVQIFTHLNLIMSRFFKPNPVAWPEGGGLQPLHWPEEYAKYYIFSTYKADVCTKNENRTPPPLALAMRIGQRPDVYLTRKTGF